MTKPLNRQSDTEREQRKGWVVSPDSFEVVEAVGYFCDNPADPDREYPYWWVPTIGYSIPEERLYETHLKAACAALDLARLHRKQAEVRVERYDLLVHSLAAMERKS